MSKIHSLSASAQSKVNAKLLRLAAMGSLEGVPAPGTRWIPLTRGKFAIVDEADYEWLNQWNWHLLRCGYAVRSFENKMIYMHRLINNTPKGMETDHINDNKLDNQRLNLRSCTKAQHRCKRLVTKTKRFSKFKGVFKNPTGGNFNSKVSLNGKDTILERFKAKLKRLPHTIKKHLNFLVNSHRLTQSPSQTNLSEVALKREIRRCLRNRVDMLVSFDGRSTTCSRPGTH